MSSTAPQVLHRDEALQVSFRDAASEVLIVGFSPMHWPERGKPDRYWGDRASAKLPYAWLSIDAISEHWYSEDVWARVRGLVHDLSQRFRVRVGYGYSMGAYGALKRSADYQPRSILAFAPQCSIDPVDVGDFDTRYVVSHDACRHAGMKIAAADLGDARAFVFHDPTFAPDLEHARRLALPSVHLVPVTYLRHQVILAARGARTLTALVDCSLKAAPESATDLHRILRQSKKTGTTQYLAELAYAALKRKHVRWAHALTQRALTQDPGDEGLALLHLKASIAHGDRGGMQDMVSRLSGSRLSDHNVVVLARAMTLLGDPAAAVATLDRRSIREGRNPRHLRSLADAWFAAGDVSRALEVADQLMDLTPRDPHAMLLLARLLMKDRASPTYDPARAVRLLEQAVTLSPDAAAFWKPYAFALELTGAVQGALEAWARVETLSALTDADRARLARLHQRLAARSKVAA